MVVPAGSGSSGNMVVPGGGGSSGNMVVPESGGSGGCASYRNSGSSRISYLNHPSSAHLQFADPLMLASSAGGVWHNDDPISNSWLGNYPAPAKHRGKLSAECTQAVAPGLSLSMNIAAGMPPPGPLFPGREQGVLESVSTLTQRMVAVGSAGSGALVPAGVDITGGNLGGALATRKSASTFGQRTSIYLGVNRHRASGKYEARLWDNSCRREGHATKGRQVYIGVYEEEEKAAIAYDLAALKYWGPTTTTNFPVLIEAVEKYSFSSRL